MADYDDGPGRLAARTAEEGRAAPGGAPDPLRQRLLDEFAGTRVILKPGDRAGGAGDEPNAGEERAAALEGSVCLVESGWLLEERFDASGARICPRIFLPGDLAGTAALSGDAPLPLLRAQTECDLLAVGAAPLREAIAKDADLAALFLARETSARREAESRLLRALRGSAEHKIAYFALHTLDRLKRRNPALRNQFHFPLNQTDLGDHVGLTSEHVSRTLNRLADEDLISFRRHFIRLLDRDRLAGRIGYRG